MITVHHLENSRSQRVLWLLEELELDYEVRRYERDRKSSLAPPELKAVHPLGKSPVITDGDLTVAETGAIIEHVLETHGGGRLLPERGTPEHHRYRYWLHAGEGTVMPLLVMRLLFTKTTQKPVPFLIRPITKAVAGEVERSYIGPSLRANVEHMESELGAHPWFAGDELTGADVMMSFPAEAIATGLDRAEIPHLTDFLARVHERPAWKRALERGGPYQVTPR